MMPINLDSLCAELQKVRREIVNDISAVLRAVTRQDSRGLVDPSDTETASPNYCVWYKDPASVWHLSLPPASSKVIAVGDCVGLSYLQTILQAHPRDLTAQQVRVLAGGTGIAYPISDMAGTMDTGAENESGPDQNEGLDCYETRQDAFDPATENQINKELEYIEHRLRQAELLNDQSRIDSLTSEKKQYLRYLKNGRGINKRPRQLANTAEFSRDAVQKGIGRAIAIIATIDAEAGEFLRKHIRVGYRVRYTGPETAWKFQK